MGKTASASRPDKKRTFRFRPDFEYSHSPLKSLSDNFQSQPTDTHKNKMEYLRSLIEKSDGGSVLVSGYRGVGKTSLVHRTLLEMNPYYEILAETPARESDAETNDRPQEASEDSSSGTDEVERHNLSFLDLLRVSILESKRDNAEVEVPLNLLGRLRERFPIVLGWTRRPASNDLEAAGERLNEAIENYDRNEILEAIDLVWSHVRSKVEMDPGDLRKLRARLRKLRSDVIRKPLGRVYLKVAISLARSIDPKVVVFRLIRQLHDHFKEKFWRQLMRVWWLPVLVAIEVFAMFHYGRLLAHDEFAGQWAKLVELNPISEVGVFLAWIFAWAVILGVISISLVFGYSTFRRKAIGAPRLTQKPGFLFIWAMLLAELLAVFWMPVTGQTFKNLAPELLQEPTFEGGLLGFIILNGILLLVPPLFAGINAVVSWMVSVVMPGIRWWSLLKAWSNALAWTPFTVLLILGGIVVTIFTWDLFMADPTVSLLWILGISAMAVPIALFAQLQLMTVSAPSWYFLRRANRKTYYETSRESTAAAGIKGASIGFARKLRQLPYEYSDAEVDLQNILRSLSEVQMSGQTLVPVFIFDELDKIPVEGRDDQGSRRQMIEDSLASLKVLFTEPSAFYIFVAGRDATESWMEDETRSQGLYESVFSQHVYVPSLLSCPEPSKTENNVHAFSAEGLDISYAVEYLTKSLFDWSNTTKQDQDFFHEFCLYLTFKSRGVIRKLLREVYGFVQTEKDGSVCIVFDRADVRRIKFYAYLQSVIAENGSATIAQWDDRERVSMYYLVDYILKFYRSGFDWIDITGGLLFPDRNEPLPTNHVVQSVLDILEGPVLVRTDSSVRSYKFDRRIRSEIESMVIASDEEQVEFRFVHTDFEKAMRHHVELDTSDRRLPSENVASIDVQLSIGQMHSLCKEHHLALLHYGRAVRLGFDELARRTQGLELGAEGSVGQLHAASLRPVIHFIASALVSMGHTYEELREYQLSALYYSDAILVRSGSWQALEVFGDPTLPANDLRKLEDVVDLVELHLPDVLANGETRQKRVKALLSAGGLASDGGESLRSGFGMIETLRSGLRHTPGLIHTVNLLAHTMDKLGKRDRAEGLLWAGLAVARIDGDWVTYTDQLKRMGDYYFACRDVGAAELLYAEVLEINREEIIRLPARTKAESYNSMGSLLFAAGIDTWDSDSEDPFRRALDLYLSGGNSSQAIRILHRRVLYRTQMAQSTQNDVDRIRRYERILKDLESALSMSRDKHRRHVDGSSSLRDERKYALTNLYIGNFILMLIRNVEDRGLLRSPAAKALVVRLTDLGLEAREYVKKRNEDPSGKEWVRPRTAVEMFFTCEQSQKVPKDLRQLYVHAENCFIAAENILVEYTNVFDRAFLCSLQGQLYFDLANKVKCAGCLHRARKGPEHCGSIEILGASRRALDEANRIHGIHIESDHENLCAYGDSSSDVGNVHMSALSHAFRYWSKKNLLELNIDDIERAAVSKAVSLFPTVELSKEIAVFHHRSNLLNRLEDVPDVPLEMIDKDALNSMWERLMRGVEQDPVISVFVKNTFEGSLADIKDSRVRADLSSRILIEVEVEIRKRVDHVEATLRGRDPKKEFKDQVTLRRYFVRSVIDSLDASRKAFGGSLRMFSREFEGHEQIYPLRRDLYYVRDDFSDSSEHWKQALHYWKRKKKSDGFDVPGSHVVGSARHGVYSYPSVFEMQLLSQMCSGSTTGKPDVAGRVYFDGLGQRTPQEVD